MSAERTPRVVTLTELRPGQAAVIVAIGGTGAVRRRYMELGLTKGEVVRVTHVAPLGDPVAYRVKGYELALRREEAEEIRAEVVED
ncbi:MAG: ferrous iron transport protein A [Anaerolineales bacterium]|nr:ferrous iron transport protein A [Anaerolineales bacterium]